MLTKEQIGVAVEWWAKALRNPKFDNGDDSNAGGMAMVLALMARGNGPSAGQIETFKSALAVELEKAKNDYYSVNTDYGPGYVLGLAADKAGISGSAFPWKTMMYFQNGGVQVACGYGAKAVELMEREAAQ